MITLPKVCGPSNITPICDVWTDHSNAMSINMLLLTAATLIVFGGWSQGSVQARQALPHQTGKNTYILTCVWRHCHVKTGKGLEFPPLDVMYCTYTLVDTHTHTQFLCLRTDMMFSLEDRGRETDKQRRREKPTETEGREWEEYVKTLGKRNKVSAKEKGREKKNRNKQEERETGEYIV